MKKSTKTRPSARKNQAKAKPNATAPAEDTRRDILRKARNAAIGIFVVGGGGIVLARGVSGTLEEQDLSRVENGMPTIVQIHDPQCSLCRGLQRQTRTALKHFDDGALDYVVANIRTAEGSRFAAQHGVQHVTLLLFDSEGTLQTVLQGQRHHRQLRDAFQRLLSN